MSDTTTLMSYSRYKKPSIVSFKYKIYLIILCKVQPLLCRKININGISKWYHLNTVMSILCQIQPFLCRKIDINSISEWYHLNSVMSILYQLQPILCRKININSISQWCHFNIMLCQYYVDNNHFYVVKST